MKSICPRLILLAAIVIFVLGAAPQEARRPEPPDISNRINTFAIAWLKQTASNLPVANTVMAPMSIFDDIAMSYIASGGQTRTQLADALHFPPNNDDLANGLSTLRRQLRESAHKAKIDLQLANSIWLDSTYAKFREEYKTQLAENFEAPPKTVAFRNAASASDTINRWVFSQTRGVIPKIVSPADFVSKSGMGLIDEPAIVSISAVYFKADWGSRFNDAETCPKPFQIDADHPETATMMHQKSLLRFGQNQHASFLELPYKDDSYSMWVFLPQRVVPIKDLVNELTAENLLKMEKSAIRCNVDVLLPKFDLRTSHNLRNSLSKMGATNCFDSELSDFDGMIHRRPEALRVYLSEVRQQAWIEIHEKGTKAAAATAGVHYSFGCSIPYSPPAVDFHADHPFLFFVIHNNTQTILFAGWFSDPKELVYIR